MSEIYLTTDWHLFKLKETADIKNLSAFDFVRTDNYGTLFRNLINISTDSLLIVMGDIAYRDKANEISPEILVELFKDDIRNLPYVKMLIKGNNDRYGDEVYKNIGFDIVCSMTYIDELFITHKPIAVGDYEVNIHGHLHRMGFDSISLNHIQIPPVEDNPEAPVYKLTDVLMERSDVLNDPEYTNSNTGIGKLPKVSIHKDNPIDLRDLFDDVSMRNHIVHETSGEIVHKIQPVVEPNPSYNKVLDIIKRIPQNEHHKFFDVNRGFVESPYLVYRDIEYITVGNNVYAGFIEVYNLKDNIGTVIIAVEPNARGTGLSDMMIRRMKSNIPTDITSLEWKCVSGSSSEKLAKRNGFKEDRKSDGNTILYYTCNKRNISESSDEETLVLDNDDLMEEIEVLMKRMSSVRYLEDIDGKTYRTIDTPEDLIHRGGVCWDFVLYQTDYLNKLECENINVRNFYTIFNDKETYPTHTFTVIEVKPEEDGDEKKFIYIEAAFSHLAGVYESTSIDAIIRFVVKGVIDKYELNKIPVQVFEFDATDEKLFYATSYEFMHHVEKHGKKVSIKNDDTTEVNHVHLESLNESGSVTAGISNIKVDVVNPVQVEDIYPAYVVLMHTNTEFSNVIKTFTRAEYSHSSISLDTSLRRMYTFNRKGFFIEDYKSEFFQDHEIPFSMYLVPLTKKEFNKLKSRIKWFEKNRDKFVYDTVGCVTAYFGIPNSPQDKYFCSRFVADVLNYGKGNTGKLVKDPSLVFPSDFINFSFTKLIYTGSFLSYDRKEADRNASMVLESIRSHQDSGFIMMEGKMYTTESLNSVSKNKFIPKNPWLKHMSTEDNTIIIKSESEDLIGAASVSKEESEEDGLTYINIIHVSEKYRKKGFGRKLLNICVTKFKATALTVRKDDKQSIRVYEKFGFRKFKSSDKYYHMKINSQRMFHLVEDAEEVFYIPETFTEPKPNQFKVILNDDGSIRLTDREVRDLNAAYKSSVKMLRVYNKSNNVQGLKDEACKIYYMIQIIDKYYLNNRSNNNVKSMIDLRANLYSTLTTTLKDIAKHDKNFDFYTYYSKSKYSTDMRIPKTHIQALFKCIVTLIKL